MNKHKVYLSFVAEFKLESLIEYLTLNWGEKSKQKFLKELKQAVAKIESFPESCRRYDSINDIYKSVASNYLQFVILKK
ncbi:type II toxin-antitoxin system RelE/ParE family toxin [Reichenbachiella versicolor]|uniref:type II toxin-antitoxin system RelE/ParE family toxin n=1 Tax=Reichenbachiella versicolor TaxID=1821036 RepID=UPI000D6E3944